MCLCRWRGRCESQLNMLAVCKGNGLFDIVPEKEFAYDCPFVISDPYSQGKHYVTPSGCMVYHAGSFYDPCRHPIKPCSSTSKVTFSLQEIVAAGASTLVRFDVRSTGSGEVLGEWPIKFYDADEGKNAVAAQVVERILRWKATSSSSTGEEDAAFEAEGLTESAENRGANIPWRLSNEFIQVSRRVPLDRDLTWHRCDNVVCIFMHRTSS